MKVNDELRKMDDEIKESWDSFCRTLLAHGVQVKLGDDIDESLAEYVELRLDQMRYIMEHDG